MTNIQGFNYVTFSNSHKIEKTDNSKTVKWHDIIDIEVPVEPNPEIVLCKRVPMPLWGRNPRSILTEIDPDWWERTRKKVYEVSNFRCMCCGLEKSQQLGYPKYLDAHELYDINYETGEVRLKYIVSLCHSMCHRAIHFGRWTSEFEKGNIDEKTFFSVISYANTLCKDNNLPLKNWDASVNDNVFNVEWSKWRLILNIEGEEKSFYSLYKDEEDLKANY